MAAVSTFPGCCSVSVLYSFVGGIDIPTRDKYQLELGSGRFVSIIAEHQETAYRQLCEKYTLESQSNPFMGNHGKQLIVCVFKIKKDKK